MGMKYVCSNRLKNKDFLFQRKITHRTFAPIKGNGFGRYGEIGTSTEPTKH